MKEASKEDNSKRKALGKGLEELFYGDSIDYDKVEEKIINETSKDEVQEIPIDKLRRNPYQPRKVFDDEKLNELAESIKEHGVFQPIIVKKSLQGYEIIAGERRVRASKLAQKETIPAIVRDFSDQDMMQIAVLENLQRENLNAIEEAQAYKKLQENLNLTQEELAKKLGKSRSHITNMLGLLNLPDKVQKQVENNEISMAHARVLSKLEDKNQIETLATKIKSSQMSVRQLEDLTKSHENYKRVKNQTKTKQTNEYSYLQEQLIDKLGTKVKITNNKLEINFTNAKDLNRILEIMNIEIED